MANIKRHFSNEAVNSFNPALLPAAEESLSLYGNEQIQNLADFYGKEATIEYNGITYKSPPILEHKELGRFLDYREKKLIMRSNNLSTSPSMQAVLQTSDAYKGIFPQTFSLLNAVLSLPIGTATVERSFSDMKMIKTNRLSDCNLSRLMLIAIEGPV